MINWRDKMEYYFYNTNSYSFLFYMYGTDDIAFLIYVIIKTDDRILNPYLISNRISIPPGRKKTDDSTLFIYAILW